MNLIDKNTRIESLDFLRGIAAFGVMFFHYTAGTSIHLSDENPLRIIGAHGYLGIEIFFILSGFVIPFSMYINSYKINWIGKFLIKRTFRIEIPYLVLIVAEVLLIYVSSFAPWKTGSDERLNTYTILLHAGYLNGILGKPWLIPVFWTLAIEFQFYLLMAVLFPLFLKTKFADRLPVVAIISFLCFVMPQPYLFFNYGLSFLLGITTFQVMVGIIKMREFLAFSIGLCFLLYFHQGFVSVLVATTTLSLIVFTNCNWKWGSFLGMISYSLYLVHVPFGGRLLTLTQMYIHSEWIKSLLIFVYLVFTVFVAWIFYSVVEKPSLHLSKKIIYKHTSLNLFEEEPSK